MTSEIKVTKSVEQESANLKMVKRELQEAFPDLYVDFMDDYSPILTILPDDPNQADSVISYLEFEFPDYAIIYE